MKYIDISTSHNIAIRYELASVLYRIVAWMIDFAILFVYGIFVSALASSSEVLMYILVLSVFGFYHLAFEMLNNGQSIGKIIMKIKVVTLHGRTAKAQDYLLRWVFRMLEILPTSGLLAILYISSTEKHQRIGDILAQTTVIRLRSNSHYDLNDLVSLGSKERDITYPNVKKYNDKDMMLVKDALSRITKSASLENKKFVQELSDNIALDLDVNLDNIKRVTFLEILLLDYIALTR